MQLPNVQLPRLGRLGIDPEPLGTERYERLMDCVQDEQTTSSKREQLNGNATQREKWRSGCTS
jgi:hypothetical protein